MMDAIDFICTEYDIRIVECDECKETTCEYIVLEDGRIICEANCE